MDDTKVDRALLKKLAEDVVFGPQSSHQAIRHNALMKLTDAYKAALAAGYKEGYEARKKEEEAKVNSGDRPI